MILRSCPKTWPKQVLWTSASKAFKVFDVIMGKPAEARQSEMFGKLHRGIRHRILQYAQDLCALPSFALFYW